MFEIGTDGPTSILVGVDGTETSMRAAAYAAGLARRQGSRLVVVFVRTPPAGLMPEAVVLARDAQERLVAQLKGEAEAGAERLGLRYTFYERAGSPFAEIVRLAGELRVDAVVVGASTQAGHRLVGSLATHLVREARWPVTVVP